MRIYFRSFLLLLLAVCSFSACKENIETEEEFVNWKESNALAFKKTLSIAHQAIAQAKAEYGDEWEDHCDWRAYRSYAQYPTEEGKTTDSICVKIVERGGGSGCPIYTDSVTINYVGRLYPSPSYPDGYVFDSSSKGGPVEDAFNPEFAQPAKFLVSHNVEGFTTALQKMHIGDRWKIFMPTELGYGGAVNEVLPSYSALIFEVKLLAYYRAGVIPDQH